MNISKKRTILNDLKSHLSQEFLSYRHQHNLTQEQFARMLEISVRAYCNIERGASIPSLLTLLRFMCIILPEKESLELIDRLVTRFNP